MLLVLMLKQAALVYERGRLFVFLWPRLTNKPGMDPRILNKQELIPTTHLLTVQGGN